MYIYYVLRGTQTGKPVELEGDVDEEHFPGVNLDDGPAIINFLAQKLNQDTTTVGSSAPIRPANDAGASSFAQAGRTEWEECDLTDSFFNREDAYLFYNNRWMRRSDTPWRRDKG